MAAIRYREPTIIWKYKTKFNAYSISLVEISQMLKKKSVTV